MTREFDRLFRVIDMLLSMHSRLADWYRGLSFCLNSLLFSASAALLALTFFDLSNFEKLGISKDAADLGIKLSTLVVFMVSLVGLIVDFSGSSTKHDGAYRALADLKSKCRELKSRESEASEEGDFIRSANSVLATLPSIPDKKFVALKAYHKRKVAMSQVLDKYPFVSPGLLKIRVAFQGIGSLFAPTLLPVEVEEHGTVTKSEV